jgi:hypothetical protein
VDPGKLFQLHKKTALFTYEVDFDGHDVSKMLSVGGGEVEGAADHGQAAQVTLRAQDARRLVQVETAVRVTRHDPGMRKECVTRIKRLNVDLMKALKSLKLYT